MFKNIWILTTCIFAFLFLISTVFLVKNTLFNSLKNTTNSANDPVLTKISQEKKLEPSDGGFVDCVFNSKYFGFSFVYFNQKGFCFVEPEEDITSYSWPTSVDNLLIYPRNNLSGKVWWKKHIYDEAGYLADNKYSFEFSKTTNGVEKMSVYVSDFNLVEGKDLGLPGMLRGSDYYFGENWVIRRKVISSGGPAENIEKFEETVKLIPILN